MPKSYKTQLLGKISDYKKQIEEIDQEVDQLAKESKKGFLALLFGARDYSFKIQPLLNKKSEIQQLLGKLEEESQKDYVYGRRLFVKGTKYREEGEVPFRKLAGIPEDEDDMFYHEIVTTKNFKLVPEPTNQADENAIKVMVEGYFVGYIDRRYSKGLKKYLDNDKYIIEGEVIGTGGSFDGDTSYPIRYDIELRIRKK
nr:MAG TPA: HIRAN protein [Caudoviricetes sp.]